MRAQHFDNQCSFRKQLLTDSFRLHQHQQEWAQRDSLFTAALNKHLHDQDVKTINRQRIIKIMQHESTHFWLHPQHAEQRITEDTLFPEFVASSEYYYKLFAEALAYELGDFQQLHRVTSNEEIIREKNKYLIPLFLQLRTLITTFKRQHLNTQPNEQPNGQTNGQSASAQTDPTSLLQQRLSSLLTIFNTWKQYTNVLALTAAQILKNQQ